MLPLKPLFFLICSVFNVLLFSQYQEPAAAVSYGDFKIKIEKPGLDPNVRQKMIADFIRKTKENTNLPLLFDLYGLASKYRVGKEQLKYGDSLLVVAQKIGTVDKMGEAHLARGMMFTHNEDHTKALESYLTAYQYLKKKNNPYLIHNLEYNIAQTKNYLGLHGEARVSLQKAVQFFRKNHPTLDGTDYRLYYVYSLIALIDTNTRLGYYADNPPLIAEGKKFIAAEDMNSYLPYLLNSEGMQHYHKKEYPAAIEKLNSALSLHTDHWDHLMDHFYLGLSYWETGQKEKAVAHFTILDQKYDKEKKINPIFRPAFEKLYEYYLEKKDENRQLDYINKLLTLHKTYEKEYKRLQATLRSEYDLKKLETEKQNLEKSVIRQKTLAAVLLVAAALLLTGLLYFVVMNRKRRRLYNELYEKYSTPAARPEIQDNAEHGLPAQQAEHPEAVLETPHGDSEVMNPAVVRAVTAKLEAFEKNRDFMHPEVSLKQLATRCGTNTTYLSRIINQQKNRNFNQYINDLRLDEVLLRWKTLPKTRQYSIQRTAEEAGFSSAQSFARNFKERFQISPTYFLKKLNEEQPVDKSTEK